MNEIRGTSKKTTDRVNEPVRKWGFPSFTLAFILVGFMISGLVLGILLGIYVVLYLLLYAFFVVRLSRYMEANRKRGIENPIGDRLEFGSMSKQIKQNIDFKAIYESKRGE